MRKQILVFLLLSMFLIVLSPDFTPKATAVATSSILEDGNRYYADTLGSYDLSASSRRYSIRFTSYSEKTVTQIRLYCTLIGSPPSYRFGLQLDAAGYPSGVYLNYTDVVPSANWNTFNIPDTILDANQVYHIVVEPVGVPDGSNFVRFADYRPFMNFIPYDRTKDTNLNSLSYDGSSWSIRDYTPVWILDFSDSSYYGNPYATSVGTAGVYVGVYVGQLFNTSSQAVTIRSISFFIKDFGSPTDDVYVNITDETNGITLINEKFALESEITSTLTWFTHLLSHEITLAANTQYRVYLKSPGTDLTNRYAIGDVHSALTVEPYISASWRGNDSVFTKYSGGAWTNYPRHDASFKLGVYNFIFYGLYDETSGDLTANGVNVTAFFTDGSATETFEVNGTITMIFDSAPQYFHFELGANDRQYWLDENEMSGTIYIYNDSTTNYIISFLDLANILDTYPTVLVQLYVNGILRTIEKRRVDVENKVHTSLVNGRKYVLKITDGTTTYTYGDLAMTSTTTIQLTLKGVDFPKETLLIYKYVRIYGLRAFGNPNGNITITYQDTLEMTTSVDIYINYKNGTNVYNATETSDSFVHTWTSALNNTDYAVVVNINHQRYGVYTWKQYFPRIFSEAPWGLEFLGSLPFDTSILIPSFLILIVAGCFSVINAEIGAFMAVITAIILAYLGWIPIGPGVLLAALTLAIIMGIIYAKRRVVT